MELAVCTSPRPISSHNSYSIIKACLSTKQIPIWSPTNLLTYSLILILSPIYYQSIPCQTMSKTVGLPYHLGYPLISCIFLAIAAFSSADSVWYVSVATKDQVIRFASQDYCGYDASNLIITGKLGCIFRGFQYQIPDGYFGFAVPNDINMNLSKAVVTNVVGGFPFSKNSFRGS